MRTTAVCQNTGTRTSAKLINFIEQQNEGYAEVFQIPVLRQALLRCAQTVKPKKMEQFIKADLTAEEAFWVMWYFLKEHYDLSGGTFDVSDILSASQPMEFNSDGHFDGRVLGNRTIAPADSGMVSFWNEAIEKYKKFGFPSTKDFKN